MSENLFENAAREQASRRLFGDLSPDQQEHLMAVWWMDLPPHHEWEPFTESSEVEKHLLDLFRDSLLMGAKVDTKRLVRQIREAIFDYLFPIVQEAYEAALNNGRHPHA